MIKRIISKGKDGYRIKVWHTDDPSKYVRFLRLPDIEEARTRQKSAEYWLFRGTSTEDAGATVEWMIKQGFGRKAENIELIGRTAEVGKTFTDNGRGWHTKLSAAIATRKEVWAKLVDGRYRKVHTYRMAPQDLVLDLYYIGGVLYWKNEKREPIGYCINRGVLSLFYIGEKHA